MVLGLPLHNLPIMGITYESDRMVRAKILNTVVRWDLKVRVAIAVAVALGLLLLWVLRFSIDPVPSRVPDAAKIASSSGQEARTTDHLQQVFPVAATDVGQTTPRVTTPSRTTNLAEYIIKAFESESPTDLLQAASVIDTCNNVDGDLDIVLNLKGGESNTNPKLNAAYLGIIDKLQSEQRQCQTLTGEIRALREKLIFKAIQGNAPGAASAYLVAVGGINGVAPEKRTIVSNALSADAQNGNLSALRSLVIGGSKFDVRYNEYVALESAFREISRKYPGATGISKDIADLMKPIANGVPELDATETAKAKQRADEIVAAYERRRKAPT